MEGLDPNCSEEEGVRTPVQSAFQSVPLAEASPRSAFGKQAQPFVWLVMSSLHRGFAQAFGGAKPWN